MKLITGKGIKDNSISSADIKDGSLLKSDFKAGQLPSGPPGPMGPVGPTGARGPAGPGSLDQLSWTVHHAPNGAAFREWFSTQQVPAHSIVEGTAVTTTATQAQCPFDLRIDVNLSNADLSNGPDIASVDRWGNGPGSLLDPHLERAMTGSSARTLGMLAECYDALSGETHPLPAMDITVTFTTESLPNVAPTPFN